MLVNLRFKNFRSFYDETVLSMEATSSKELDEINTFVANEKLFLKDDNKLLKAVMVFGGNASGKTNIVRALSYMVNVVNLSSSPQIQIVERNEMFAFEANNEQESLYEVEFVSNDVFYKYGFVIKDNVIVKEWLFKRHERLTRLFERNNDTIDIIGLTKQSAKLIRVPSSSLFLSIGNNFKLDINEDLSNVLNWFRSILIVMENTANAVDIYSLEGGKYMAQALEILKLADIGIKDMRVVKDKLAQVRNLNDFLSFSTQMQIDPLKYVGQIKQENNEVYNIDLETSFDIFDRSGEIVDSKKVMLFKERHFNSEGTHRLLCYMGWILAALDQGRLIVIDEIDSKLHFLVADYIIRLFNSIDKNPFNSQLVCTAHNVLLMDEDLRRDQIYFTSKDRYGKSNLVSLADYKNVRKNDLFSKKYLAGFYANLPDMKAKG